MSRHGTTNGDKHGASNLDCAGVRWYAGHMSRSHRQGAGGRQVVGLCNDELADLGCLSESGGEHAGAGEREVRDLHRVRSISER